MRLKSCSSRGLVCRDAVGTQMSEVEGTITSVCKELRANRLI